MVRRQKLEALVLSRRNVGEADRLVTLFTRDHGLLKVLAKGVRKIPSQRGGHLEPLTQVLAIVTGTAGRHFLAAAETLDYLPALHKDEDAVARAQRMAQLVPTYFGEESQQENVYRALVDAWQMLPDLTEDKRALLEVSVMMLVLQEAGEVPQLAKCMRCGEAQPDVAVIMDAERGGWSCLTCWPVPVSESMSPQMLKVLRFMVAQPTRGLRVKVGLEQAEQLLGAVKRYALPDAKKGKFAVKFS